MAGHGRRHRRPAPEPLGAERARRTGSRRPLREVPAHPRLAADPHREDRVPGDPPQQDAVTPPPQDAPADLRATTRCQTPPSPLPRRLGWSAARRPFGDARASSTSRDNPATGTEPVTAKRLPSSVTCSPGPAPPGARRGGRPSAVHGRSRPDRPVRAPAPAAVPRRAARSSPPGGHTAHGGARSSVAPRRAIRCAFAASRQSRRRWWTSPLSPEGRLGCAESGDTDAATPTPPGEGTAPGLSAQPRAAEGSPLHQTCTHTQRHNTQPVRISATTTGVLPIRTATPTRRRRRVLRGADVERTARAAARRRQRSCVRSRRAWPGCARCGRPRCAR
jgi:hypothetical protein